jgi:beta-phosphoglucomutase
MSAEKDRSSIDAVIFDLDGVLVSTDEYHYQSWQRLADEEGIPFDREFNERFRGVSRMECLAMLLENADRRYTTEEKQELADRKNGYYREMIQHLSPKDMLPGARAMVDELKRRGLKVAVASGSKNAPFILDRIALGDELDAAVSGQDIENSKPDPEIFELAANQIDEEPENCLVVEDAQSGVEAARRAGMRALGIGEEPLEGAENTVRSVADISADELVDL